MPDPKSNPGIGSADKTSSPQKTEKVEEREREDERAFPDREPARKKTGEF